MRIRKHANVFPVENTAASRKEGRTFRTHLVCRLNQSPWDVITFPPPDSSDQASTPPLLPPPPPSMVERDGGSVDNGTFPDRKEDDVSVGERERWDNAAVPVAAVGNKDGGAVEENFEFRNNLLCCKTDGKDWRCRRKVTEGRSYCEHHCFHHQSYANSTHNFVRKSESHRRARPKKPAALASNPYEFYYYSGFGPRWGKKRGSTTEAGAEDVIARSAIISIGSGASSVDVEVDELQDTPASSGGTASLNSQLGSGGLDCVDNEEKEEWEEAYGEVSGEKRSRKPIKARSLKSLM